MSVLFGIFISFIILGFLSITRLKKSNYLDDSEKLNSCVKYEAKILYKTNKSNLIWLDCNNYPQSDLVYDRKEFCAKSILHYDKKSIEIISNGICN